MKPNATTNATRHRQLAQIHIAKSEHRLQDCDLHKLRQMLGVSDYVEKKHWGYRNKYAPGITDVESMERLEALGLVVRGRKYYGTNFFRATKAGCEAAGLNSNQTKNALED